MVSFKQDFKFRPVPDDTGEIYRSVRHSVPVASRGCGGHRGACGRDGLAATSQWSSEGRGGLAATARGSQGPRETAAAAADSRELWWACAATNGLHRARAGLRLEGIVGQLKF